MTDVKLSPTKQEDLELLMAWRSHPLVYTFFKKQQEPLTWQEHYNWWQSNEDRQTFLISFEEANIWRKVGCITIDNLKSETPEIGIYIGEVTANGKGLGTKALQLAVEWLKETGHHKLKAVIHKDNIASQKLFSRAHFKQGPTASPIWLEFVYQIS